MIHHNDAQHNFLQGTPHEHVVDEVVHELKINNPLFHMLAQLGNTTDTHMAVRIDGYSHARELAIIRTASFNTRNRTSLFIKKIDDGFFQEVTPGHPKYEALSFPVFFTQGESGWDFNRTKLCGLLLLPYTRSRILTPERILAQNQSGQLIPVNRFQLLARLMQLYVLENFSRYIDLRLEYLRKNQRLFQLHTDRDDVLFGPGADEFWENDHHHDNANNNDPDMQQPADINDTTDQRVILPASFLWSQRHKKMRAANALHLVSRLGRPTLFITATTNPLWPEIAHQLLEGQMACDRPDVTARVFASKLEVLLSCLRRGQFLPPANKVIYEVYVTEFQKRGLPHAHIVVKLGNMPTAAEAIAAWVDTFINTAMPPEGTDDEYRQAIQNFMVHRCDDRYGHVAHTPMLMRVVDFSQKCTCRTPGA